MTSSIQTVNTVGKNSWIKPVLSNITWKKIFRCILWGFFPPAEGKSQTALQALATVNADIYSTNGRGTCWEPQGAQVMRCFRKPELISLNLTLSEPQLNGSAPQSLGQSSDSRISEISSCTADGFLDGSEQRRASAASLSNLFHFKKLSLKLLIVRSIREC